MFDERWDKLCPHSGTNADAYWQFLLWMDGKEHLAMRMKQKVYLARYGRIDPFSWESREITELDAYFFGMIDLVSKENDLSKSSEDR